MGRADDIQVNNVICFLSLLLITSSQMIALKTSAKEEEEEGFHQMWRSVLVLFETECCILSLSPFSKGVICVYSVNKTWMCY